MDNQLEIQQDEFLNIISNFFSDFEIKNIMEIGSLNGNDSRLYKSRYPNANVYCIEGLKENFDLYIKNDTEIIPINTIVADFDGTITFHKKDINGIHSIYNRGNDYGTEILNNQTCKTFDTICNEYNIPNIDIIKIDVEGATFDVLVGMKERIKDIKIMHIETESAPFFEGQKLHDEVADYLSNNDFELVKITKANINGYFQHDSVWINKKFIK